VRYLHAVQEEGKDITAWIDLLMLIPCWVGVLGLILLAKRH
jgi:hypothetical protein